MKTGIRTPLLVATIAFLAASLPSAGATWTTYKTCTLVADGYHDGDSFSVQALSATRSYRYIFRLYGADCPEIDRRFPERIAEQAQAFSIDEEQIPVWGEKARRFTADFLARPFRVYTKKSKARGASAQVRYYAVVIGADGRDLAEALVEAGLARAYGSWPRETIDGEPGDRYRRNLERKESAARHALTGMWRKTPLPAAALIYFQPWRAQ